MIEEVVRRVRVADRRHCDLEDGFDCDLLDETGVWDIVRAEDSVRRVRHGHDRQLKYLPIVRVVLDEFDEDGIAACDFFARDDTTVMSDGRKRLQCDMARRVIVKQRHDFREEAEYQKAMMRCAQDHDLVSLGRTLATLIQRTEFAIAEGSFRTEGPNGTWRDDFDIGLPFKMWTDALPHCAKALRARGTSADLDMADVVELKYFIIRSRIPDAISAGQRAIARNPNLAYAYYAISMGADHAEGLRAVKKGLKCKELTPFVRNYLLWRAVEHAGDLGVMTLQESKAGERDHSEGVAFLMSAWDDAKTFVAEAPPDNRHMQTIINWYIILQLAIKGPELSENLAELTVCTVNVRTETPADKSLLYPHRKYGRNSISRRRCSRSSAIRSNAPKCASRGKLSSNTMPQAYPSGGTSLRGSTTWTRSFSTIRRSRPGRRRITSPRG